MPRELKQETLAEIEEELRSGEYAPLADRIHAAWERERDELIYSYDPTKAEKSRAPDGSAYALEALEHPACTPIGNASAMYAALKEMQARLVAGVQDGTMDCYEALEIVEKALSKPPRNCDVGTAEEQEERFDAFCKSHVRMCKECPIRPAYGHYCHLAWGQMPYRAEEGAGK